MQRMLLVRPHEGPTQDHYKRYMHKIEINQHILPLNYPIELIRSHLSTNQHNFHYCNFIKLRYWQDRHHLVQLINNSHAFTAFCLKLKINLQGFINIGQKLVEGMAAHTSTFKSLIYHYTNFQECYLDDPEATKSRAEYL